MSYQSVYSFRKLGRAALRAALPVLVLVLSGAAGFAIGTGRAEAPVEIGNRIEMFVDLWLVDRSSVRNATLQMTGAERREVVLTTDQPWEGISSAYYTAIQDGKKVRLYYRGYCPEDSDNKQVTCMAESTDGIHFSRPDFGLFDFPGARHNNIIWQGIESHNFGPFLDDNPAAIPDQRYKALGGINSKLYAFQSPDGIHWKRMQAAPVITDGAFDSLNTAFWDSQAHLYRCYSRYWDSKSNVRAIQVCTSNDFIHWSKPLPNRYADGVPSEQFYTNATRPCPGAPHQLLSFPKRFVPERTRLSGYKEPGVSDSVFMSSRDGEDWDRSFVEAWIRPGQDQQNWTQRSNMPAAGIVQLDDEPGTFTMYISRHYQWPDNGLQRVTIRKFGFASMHAGRAGGEFTTRPVVLSGSKLLLNMATSAPGSVQAEMLDETGKPLPGYALKDCPPLFGDNLDRTVEWRGKSLAPLAGKTVRIHFVLVDADIYSLQIAK